MKSVDEIVAAARREVSEGRAWRAKEIVGGHIASGRIEPSILEEYGRLLESLGDRVEAGKYLFLAGARGEVYSQSIALFKARHGRRRGRDLVSQLPAAFRRQPFENVDARLRDELVTLGVTAEHFGRRLRADRLPVRLAPWRQRLATAIFVAVLLILFVAIIVGLKTMVVSAWHLWQVGEAALSPMKPHTS